MLHPFKRFEDEIRGAICRYLVQRFEDASNDAHPDHELLYAGGRWWNKYVWSALDDRQQEDVSKKNHGRNLNALDFSQLASVLIKNWAVLKLPSKGKHLFSELKAVRARAAHVTNIDNFREDKYQILRDVDTMVRAMEIIASGLEICTTLAQAREDVARKLGTSKWEALIERAKESLSLSIHPSKRPEIVRGVVVVRADSPAIETIKINERFHILVDLQRDHADWMRGRNIAYLSLFFLDCAGTYLIYPSDQERRPIDGGEFWFPALTSGMAIQPTPALGTQAIICVVTGTAIPERIFRELRDMATGPRLEALARHLEGLEAKDLLLLRRTFFVGS